MNYYPIARNLRDWGDTVRISQSEAADVTGWNKKERDTALTEYLSGALQGIYEVGMKRYKKPVDIFRTVLTDHSLYRSIVRGV